MSKIYSAKVSGQITEKVSSTAGLTSFYIGEIEYKITKLEYAPDATTSFGDSLPCFIIHYADGEIYLPASGSLDDLSYVLHPLQ